MGKTKAKKLKKQHIQATIQSQASKFEQVKDKRLQNTVRSYVQHILICTDSKSKQCKKGGPQLLKAFQKGIKDRKLGRQVMVSQMGHVGGCSLGPNVIVYPEGVWYGRVSPEDVGEIIEEHILEGRIVQRLLRGQRMDDPCGSCILAKPLVVTAQPTVEELN